MDSIFRADSKNSDMMKVAKMAPHSDLIKYIFNTYFKFSCHFSFLSS